jgi:hypothetical protein
MENLSLWVSMAGGPDVFGRLSFESRAHPRGFAAILTPIVFVNAALMFSVEPMFSKLVLPFLGGTPSVWNTCLVFFQAALLVGYGYAHALTRIRDPRRRTAVHVAMLALSCLALPLAIRGNGNPPPGNSGILWLLALLTTSLGAPFVVLASGAPLAQRWLADSGHPDAANPYFLYSASNLGSLLALLSYPVLVEPWMTLSSQRAAWSSAYAMLILLLALSFAIIAWTHPRGLAELPGVPVPAIRPLRRASWALYSAVPASLLVGVTTYISTDVAAVPLLWVLPLSIYLLTFAIVFSRRPVIPHSWMVRAAPHALVIVAIPVFWNVRLPGLFGVVVHLIVLLIVAMVCHGELAQRRPPAAQLTEFFVWVAVGGLIGGAFNSLIAPVIFNRIYEYPIVLALAGMLLPATPSEHQRRGTDVLLPLVLGACVLLVTLHIEPLPSRLALVVTLAFGVTAFSFRGRPARFGLALATIFAAGYVRDVLRAGGNTVLDSERSYFGVYRVSRNAESRMVTLYHGTTLHGAQSLDPAQRLIPLTYYHPNGPSGDVFRYTLAGMKARRNVGLVGLGAGSLACYGHRGELWTYYEIDPVVARIARNSHFFTFLRDCPPKVHIVLGDARLTLAKARNEQYDILVLDAFSSDAIPVHLLTREAFRSYLGLLAAQGVIAVHISNDHLDLEPVIAAVAAELGLTARIRRDLIIPESDANQGRTPAVWAILTRSPSDLGALCKLAKWEPIRRRADVGVWTDDFSNIIRVFEWQ